MVLSVASPPPSLAEAVRVMMSGQGSAGSDIGIAATNDAKQPTKVTAVSVGPSELETPNPAASGVSLDKSQPGVGSCTVNTADINEPATKRDIEMLMIRYYSACTDKLFRVLEHIYSEEKRDEHWAAPLEAKVEEAAASTAVKSLTLDGACHTSLCRYDFKFPLSENRLAVKLAINSHLSSLVQNTRLEVREVDVFMPFGYRCYFYSNVPPAAFLEPLRKRMEGGER
jgi:hypothetical protein